MKTKGFVFISCLAASALIAAPAWSKPAKKSNGHSSRAHRTVARTAQVTHSNRYNRVNTRSHVNGTRYYGGTRYSGTRAYAGRQSGTRTVYRNGTARYGANTYYGGRGYYYGGGSYPSTTYYYSGYPYSNFGYGTSWSSYPYSYYGGYPYGYYNNYSYYAPNYAYNGSTVAAVQRRLGELGYYRGAIDGVIGPRTRGAIAAFESRNGLAVDARISRQLLASLGLA